jgi:hypothetical protein
VDAPFAFDTTVGGATIPILAIELRVGAPCAHLAQIVSTHETVGTFHGYAGGAGSGRALIVHGADVTVLARCLVRCEGAARGGLAGIVGARVAIVACQLSGKDALPQMTVVARGADVQVIAGRLIQGMNATVGEVAQVIRAEVSVTAIQPLSVDTLAQRTVVSEGTRVAVIAGRLVGHEEAAHVRQARIHGARIGIVTGSRFAGRTRPLQTEIGHGTEIAVFARGLVGNVRTSQGRLAGIVGTGVIIRAVCGDRVATFPLDAMLPHGARVAIVARTTFIGWHETALSAVRGTYWGNARSAGSFALRTHDHRTRCQCALERKLRHITVEGPGAEVSVLQRGAIGIDLAVAFHREPRALPLAALVGHGTWVPVVAVR